MTEKKSPGNGKNELGTDFVRPVLPDLSARLGAIFDCAAECAPAEKRSFAVDVGCDHGYIPIALVKSGKYAFALACDINEGPLKRAEENAVLFDAENIAFVKSDGLDNPEIFEKIREYSEKYGSEGIFNGTLTIAGMGGMLMTDILTRARSLPDYFSHLILSPQSDIPLVRKWLITNGWDIHNEKMLLEDGKYYVIIVTERDSGITAEIDTGRDIAEKNELTEEEFRFGPVLLKKKDQVLYRYLEKQLTEKESILEKLKNAGDERAQKRKQEVLEDIGYLRAALNKISRENNNEMQ